MTKKKKKETDFNKCFEKVDSKMKNYKTYLVNKISKEVDKEFSNIVKSLDLNREIINQEADNLMKIYNLSDEKDKKIIVNSLICLSYKEKMIYLIKTIKNIIEITEVKKEALYSLINTIIASLEKDEIVNTIELSNKILSIYSIDIFDKKNKLNEFLMKLYGHPDYIKFLFSTTVEECEKMKGKIIDEKLNKNFGEILKFVKIIENKEEIDKMRDKELIKLINDKINSNDEIVTNSGKYNEIFEDIDNLIKLNN